MQIQSKQERAARAARACDRVLVIGNQPFDLARWRDDYDLSQAGAAEAIGIGRSTLVEYELRRRPIPRYVELACIALGLVLPMKDGRNNG